MKLRNKKTGGLASILADEQDFIRVYTDAGWHDYDSVAEMMEDWEDYKPAEPLIKDEKVRKAVRAWAEIFNIDELCYMELHGVSGHYLCHSFHLIDVPDIEGLKVFNYYTIAELCGE